MTTPPIPATPLAPTIATDPNAFFTRVVSAHIGNNWDSHYAKAWAKLGSREGLKPVNPSAADREPICK